MRLVVNIPTYNEEGNIEEIIKKVLAQSKNLQGIDLHVLVSDSHSPDETPAIVKNLSRVNSRIHYLDVKERGIGVGLVKGHRFAVDKLKADILAQMDGDLSHNPATLPIMLAQIEKGFDLVNGSRSMPGGKNLLGWHRRLFSSGMSLYCRLAWGTFHLTEYANSYRMFTKKLFQSLDFSKLPWKSKTYIFQPAFLYGALTIGAKIKEVPITFEDRKRGYSKVQIASYILDVVRFGIKVRLEKSKTLFKFLTVGASSYLLNAVILGLLYRGSIYSFTVLKNPLLSFIPSAGPKFAFLEIDRLFLASIISIELSIIYNFIFHENWTFKDRSHKGLFVGRLLKFNLTSAGSPLIQLLSILFFAKVLGKNEQIGLAVGVAVGIFVNYTLNLLWIWRPKEGTVNKASITS